MDIRNTTAEGLRTISSNSAWVTLSHKKLTLVAKKAKDRTVKNRYSSWANTCRGKLNQNGEADRLEFTNEAYEINSKDTTYVDTLKDLKLFLPHIAEFEKNTTEAQLALDAEGVDLGRHGSITLMQLYSRSHRHKWIFDVKLLGRSLFDTQFQGNSLRRLLESREYHQTWWDVRQDSNALFFHFGIKLGWVSDGQLVCLAAQTGNRNYLPGLGKTISSSGGAWMSAAEHQEWMNSFSEGKHYFKHHGYEVFERRPIPLFALRYAAGDVSEALMLLDMNNALISDEVKDLVKEETEARLESSRSLDMPENSCWSPIKFLRLKHGNLATEKKRLQDEEERRAAEVLATQKWEERLAAENLAEEKRNTPPIPPPQPYSYAHAAKMGPR